MVNLPESVTPGTNSTINRLAPEDRRVHDWYRFVLSFPPHLVREYLENFGLDANTTVLDPFCGTGTTLVECKKFGIPSIGIERHPMSWFAANTKTNWGGDPELLYRWAKGIAQIAGSILADQQITDVPTDTNLAVAGLKTLPPEILPLLLKNSISPLPLHKILTLKEVIEQDDFREGGYDRLALAKTAVSYASNLHFGPEVGVKNLKSDAAVLTPWLGIVSDIAEDLDTMKDQRNAVSHVFLADARELDASIPPASIDAVICSPPYPNEKDYTRTTRLETVLLNFVQSKEDLRILKKGLVRSNTRGVYKEDRDEQWITWHSEIQKLAATIEERRLDLGKTSGFEKLYGRVTKLYFGGMARHLANLRRVLKPGAQLAYVVGDQASYLRVLIRTGQLVGEIAEHYGYQVQRIDLFRTRLATATKVQLREEVVVLTWPGW